jgi:hypothetical protein
MKRRGRPRAPGHPPIQRQRGGYSQDGEWQQAQHSSESGSSSSDIAATSNTSSRKGSDSSSQQSGREDLAEKERGEEVERGAYDEYVQSQEPKQGQRREEGRAPPTSENGVQPGDARGSTCTERGTDGEYVQPAGRSGAEARADEAPPRPERRARQGTSGGAGKSGINWWGCWGLRSGSSTGADWLTRQLGPALGLARSPTGAGSPTGANRTTVKWQLRRSVCG